MDSSTVFLIFFENWERVLQALARYEKIGLYRHRTGAEIEWI
ncbi:hypothetical protein EMIT074MI3_12212 [Bacillus licheniformis]|nr:hypothetical protein B4094_4000 [Bacillus licheniformis]OLF92194.1 hypothetical protein B4089_2271 [Bacillus licheniformis]